MKALSFSRMFLLLALVLGITVVWAGAAPSTTDSKSLLGGWEPYTGCISCTREYDDNCDDNATYNCDSAPIIGLLIPGSHYGYPSGEVVCSNAIGGGIDECNNLHDSCCNCCTP